MPDADISVILSKTDHAFKAPNGASGPAATKSRGTHHVGPPRIDLEPIYTVLRAAIGDQWAIYKTAFSSPEIEHHHNTLIAGIYANVFREAPDPGVVAPWVSANDKPASGAGTLGGIAKAGDKVEEKLRREVMALPTKDRKRLKQTGERGAASPVGLNQMIDYRLARSIRLPETVPASAGGLTKTNWDIEIRRRYANTLYHENGEFPDESAIANRMTPICYEEALPGGPAEQCAEYVATATEAYIKTVIADLVNLTRSKTGPSVPEQGQDRALNLGDIRFALGSAACGLGSMPDVITDVLSSWPEGISESFGQFAVEAMNLDVIEDQEIEEQKDYLTHAWTGSNYTDRERLFGVLDDCLAIAG